MTETEIRSIVIHDKRARKVWIAAIFSILAPGLGQIYCGHLVRGIMFLGLLLVAALGKNVILLIAIQQPSSPYKTLSSVILLLLAVYVLALIDAILLAKQGGDYNLKKYNKWYVYVFVFIITFFVIRPIGLYPQLVQAYIIPTDSMAPTIEIGERVLVDNFTYNAGKMSRGDIVVFRYPLNPRIRHTRRIIGLPGEIIAIHDKQVSINGEVLNEPYVVHRDKDNLVTRVYVNRDNLAGTAIPDGCLFVMGDNRDYCMDSRAWGCVDKSMIEGILRVIWFSQGQLIWKTIPSPHYQ